MFTRALLTDASGSINVIGVEGIDGLHLFSLATELVQNNS